MFRRSVPALLVLAAAASVANCVGDDPVVGSAPLPDGGTTSGGSSSSGAASGGLGGSSGSPGIDAGPSDDASIDATTPDGGTRVRCSAESVAALRLSSVASQGIIAEEGALEDEFVSLVDATAGGIQTPQGYLYARFTGSGLVKMELDDETAFASTEWDIAFRRSAIRLNSGVSGPGDVRAQAYPGTRAFGEITSPPLVDTPREEDYFDAQCELTSTSDGAPLTVLSDFYELSSGSPSCLRMTQRVYAITTAQGKLKLEVVSYYDSLANQHLCETNATIPSGTAAKLRVRWAWLQ